MEGFNISGVDLEELKQFNIETVDPADLVDIKEVNINEALTREQKVASFVSQIGNPYCFKAGKIIVGVTYSDCGISFEQQMENYLTYSQVPDGLF